VLVYVTSVVYGRAMTKKHFIAIARILANRAGYNLSTIQFDNGYNQAVEDIANDLADYLETQNFLFDRDQFLTAAGYGE
jgi:hypothetical protein